MDAGRIRGYTLLVTPERLRELLSEVQAGIIDLDRAMDRLSALPFADLGVARVDHHRALRQGVPEVVFAQGKTPEDVVIIAEEIDAREHTVLVTRAEASHQEALKRRFPTIEIHRLARVAWLARDTAPRRSGNVEIVTAGTSDLPVAEEARMTLRACGLEAPLLVDVGVAGLHRLLPELERLREADALIVVAGMEGALASVIGGLVRCPVIAVPTSVGYGASFQGLSALLGMLTSCAAGITCVNIDNGFGAAMACVRLLDASRRARTNPARERHDE
jgi:NCAIR mutase (PurE)-related protein